MNYEVYWSSSEQKQNQISLKWVHLKLKVIHAVKVKILNGFHAEKITLSKQNLMDLVLKIAINIFTLLYDVIIEWNENITYVRNDPLQSIFKKNLCFTHLTLVLD